MTAAMNTWSEIKAAALRAQLDWEVIPYYRDGVDVAGGLIRGTEVHFIIDPLHRGRIFPRRLVDEFLAPLFNRQGYLTTRVKPDDAAAIKFVTRVGFARTWFDGMFDHYMLTALPFQRS